MTALLVVITTLVAVNSQKETVECRNWNECQMHQIDANKVSCTSYIGCLSATIESKGANGYVDCLGSHSCHEAKSIIVQDGSIHCAGLKSCHQVSPTQSAKIQCSGSYSCFCDGSGKQASLMGNDEIMCGGYKSCENCKIAAKKIACDGSASCRNNDITAIENVQCRGRESCQSATVTTTGEVECSGDTSCSKAKIKSKKTTFKGVSSGKDATVNSEVVEATGYLSIEGAEIDSNDVEGGHIQVQLAGETATTDTTVVCIQGTECEVACTDECPDLEVISMSQASISVTITTTVLDISKNTSVITTLECVSTDTNAGCPTMMTSNDNCTDVVLQKYLVEKRKKIKLKRLSEEATGISKRMEMTDEYDWKYKNLDEEYAIIPARSESKSILQSDINVCVTYHDCQGAHLTQGHQQCYGYESCESAYIEQQITDQSGVSITKVGYIECFGDSSCKNGHIFTDVGNIYCDANEACQTATVLRGKFIQCAGKQSCSYIGSTIKSVSISCEGQSSCVGNFIEVQEQANCLAKAACYDSEINAKLRISCDAISACEGTDLTTKFLKCTSQESCYMSNIKATQKLTVDGDSACAYANISHTPHITAVGKNALAYATIDSEGIPDLLIKFNGDLAGMDATVICRVGSACLIDCKTSGCKKLTVICEIGAACSTKPRPCTPRKGEAPKSVNGHFCPTILKRNPTSGLIISDIKSKYISDRSFSDNTSEQQSKTPVYYYSIFIVIISVMALLLCYCDIFTCIKDKNNEKYQILHS